MGLTEHTVSLLASWGASAILPAVVTAVIAYFCGCFNGAVIVSKYILRAMSGATAAATRG